MLQGRVGSLNDARTRAIFIIDACVCVVDPLIYIYTE